MLLPLLGVRATKQDSTWKVAKPDRLPRKCSVLFQLMTEYKKKLKYTYALSIKVHLNNITGYRKVKRNDFSQVIDPVLTVQN